ncbi:MAG: PEP/pyruvate-binding domain-containing protein, partial [Cetobacterium sp.]
MKNIYLFSEGNGLGKLILGGKGANLVEMKRIGLPIPNGMVVTTTACKNYFESKNSLSREMIEEIDVAIEKLQKETKKSFEGENSLLVSVRSGAPVSMPGMMDTILNLGLNDIAVQRLIQKTKNEKFVYEIYLRFIEMFSEIVKGIPREKFVKVKKFSNGKSEKEIVEIFKNIYWIETGEFFPENPKEQIKMAIESIFNSWNNERAKIYR